MRRQKIRKGMAAVAICAMMSGQLAAPIAWAKDTGGGEPPTNTPIKHVIVLIGENRGFDHSFATYEPGNGEHVANLLEKGIIGPNGSPGPNSALATQFKVNTPLPSTYFISAGAGSKTAYSTLPTPELNGAPNHAVSLAELESNPTGVQPPFDSTISQAQLETLEPSLENDDLELMRTGATGAAGTTGLDSRITNATELPNTAFQLTGPNVPYDSYTGDTVHRLFHMWQQSDCDVANATPSNPSGCLNDLYPFVATARDD
jgi:phospholipase C